jgi:hypothetical protein
MELEVISKLRGALSVELSENQVVYILALIRKLLAHRGTQTKFFYLQFFSDWAFHVRVDRTGARRVLHHFDDWLPALLENGRAANACRFFLLFGFHLEFNWLLRETRLPEVTEKWWCDFLRFYLEVIADCPVSSGADLGLAYVKELAIERTTSGSEVSYFWKVTLKTDDIRRFPLDPKSLFKVRPTHTGEPWLWKGPVSAMVGLPEGWITDNEPNTDYQFSMYPVLWTRESAMRKGLFLYGNILLKSDRDPTMEAIADRHERVVLETVPTAKFERLTPLENEIRQDGQFPRSLLRVGHILPSYGGPEYSLYIDSPKGVLLLVLMCPEGKDETYLPALKWIGGTVVMMTRENNTPTQSA